MAPGSRFDRTPGESEEKYYHLTLLAENEVGYRNLLQLVSVAHLEGFYHRPRMDKQLLAEHQEGVDRACRAACPREIAVQLLAGQRERALATAGEYRDIFGARPLPHRAAGSRARRPARDHRQQFELARALGIPVVATNDLHYTLAERREAARRPAVHPAAEAAVRPEAAAVRRRGVLPEERRRDAARVPRAARGLRHDARDRRERRARSPSCERVPAEHKTDYHLPRFDTPQGLEPLETYLRQLVDAGAARALRRHHAAEVRERIDHELGVITRWGSRATSSSCGT